MKFELKQKLKMFCQHVVFPAVYFLNRWKKVDSSLIILADAHSESCPPYMEQIRRELIRQNYNIHEFFFDLSKLTGRQTVGKMMDFMKLYAKAGAVVVCDNFLPVASCKKRHETKVVQLWHGCGSFKRFGYDAADDIPRDYKGNVYKNYTMVTVSSENVVRDFESAMGIADKGVVNPIGVSYTDRLYDTEYLALCRDKFRYTYPDSKDKKIVLWAPSFRGNASLAKGQKALGEESVDVLAQNEEYFVIKSMHPHVRIEDNPDSYIATGELLACCDVLITDYSSVFFEYLIMDKPIVFFAPDLEEYQKNRGFYLDYSKLPGAVVCNEAELVNAVNEACYMDDRYVSDRARYREYYMSACDGDSTKRIVRYIGRA